MLAVLAGTASPHGGERRLAETFVDWAARRWPSIDWSVRPLDASSASVLASTGKGPADLVLYSHLDTSLRGDPAHDAAITGRSDPLPAYRFDAAAGTVSGAGLGVAKAPAAAAVVGFARAAASSAQTVHLLLAAQGTHRTDWSAPGPHRTGVTEYLESFPLPKAAVIAKGGPPGVLRQEPAALYLRVRLTAGWGPLMVPGALRPAGGLLAQAGALLTAVERWGSGLVTDARERAIRADPDRQDGAAFGLGAIRAGEPGKADLAPASLELFGYAVLPGPVVPGATAASLRKYLCSQLEGVRLSVEEELLGDGPATPPSAPVIRRAEAVWHAQMGGAPELIRGWTGSTDGVVFRAAGVDTARFGPRPLPAPPEGDPRVDAFDLAGLQRYARAYAEICSRRLT